MGEFDDDRVYLHVSETDYAILEDRITIFLGESDMLRAAFATHRGIEHWLLPVNAPIANTRVGTRMRSKGSHVVAVPLSMPVELSWWIDLLVTDEFVAAVVEFPECDESPETVDDGTKIRHIIFRKDLDAPMNLDTAEMFLEWITLGCLPSPFVFLRTIGVEEVTSFEATLLLVNICRRILVTGMGIEGTDGSKGIFFGGS